MDITQVQAFAAGAALCSTSLGTTFTILSTSGLTHSRLGVVLSSAAMMDDIVGLVMSSIISSLGKSSDFSAITVVRPVLVSIAFAVIVPLICLFVVKPLTIHGFAVVASRKEGRLFKQMSTRSAAVTFHTLVLITLITGASYAGTSVLFAAYLAGALSTWWDGVFEECVHAGERAPRHDDNTKASAERGRNQSIAYCRSGNTQSSCAESSVQQKTTDSETLQPDKPDPPKQSKPAEIPSADSTHLRGSQVFEKYYHPALQTTLKPFFFASIGFSIPISKMFGGTVVWKGFVYSILMIFAKLLCGFCLLRFQCPSNPLKVLKRYLPSGMSDCWPIHLRSRAAKIEATPSQTTQRETQEPQRPPLPKKPVSLYPAALLGSAMVARGEIGFLISSVAESDGVFGTIDSGGSSELFLVVTWAILLCTLLGPISVGLMVKRVQRLQATERSHRTGRDDPLGAWGIVASG